MKHKNTLHIYILILIALGLPRLAHAESISISAEITKASIAFEENDTLIVTLTWDGEPFLYQMDDFPMPELEKLQVLGSSSSVSNKPDTGSESGEITARKFIYVLQALDYGTGIIKPLNLTATNKTTGEAQVLQTGQLLVEIAKPVPKPQVKQSGLSTLLIVILCIIIIGVVVALILVMRNKKKRNEFNDTDRQYLDALEEIKKETVADRKLFFSRLYRLLILYLEKERSLNVSTKTGEEVIRLVHDIDDDEEKISLIAWMERLQKEKYRPDQPSSGDIEEMYNTVYRFFENKISK